jgi:hypothetical protein
MQLPTPTIRPALGPRLIEPPAMIRVSLTAGEISTLAAALARAAAEVEAAGDSASAERLGWRAAALREADR